MLKYSIRGENLEVTDAFRDYVVSKLEKIEKYFQAEQELDARVNLKVYREKTAKVEIIYLAFLHFHIKSVKGYDISIFFRNIFNINNHYIHSLYKPLQHV